MYLLIQFSNSSYWENLSSWNYWAETDYALKRKKGCSEIKILHLIMNSDLISIYIYKV